MEEALTKRLLASTALGAWVGKSIFWGAKPEGKPSPYITMQIAARNRDYTHDGPDDLQYPRIQFDVYGKSKAEVTKISRVLLTEMERPQEVDDIVFEESLLAYESDADAERSEAGTPKFRNTMDFMVPHRPVRKGA